MEIHKKIIGHGPLDANLWIIGDIPRAADIKDGRLFGGSAGQSLYFALESLAGIDPDHIRFETLCPVQAPANLFAHYENNQDANKVLLTYVEQLKERIRQYKPNMVLLLGAPTLKYILDETGIGKWRGHLAWNDRLGCKMMATYHPSHAARQKYAPMSEFPGQFETLFNTDVVKAVGESRTPDYNPPKYEVIINPKYQQVIDYLDEVMEKGEFLSFDIELGKPYETRVMDCIGLADSGERGICIPFCTCSGKAISPHWKEEERNEIFRKLKCLLESDMPKVAQNGVFDAAILRYLYGIKVRNIVWDTMLAAHNLYCELPKDLGTLTSLYTDMPYHKHLAGKPSIMARWEYCALDAIANIRIYRGQCREIKEVDEQSGSNTYEHYKLLTQFAMDSVIDMECRGILVDEELRAGAIKHEEEVQEEILSVLDKVIPRQIAKKEDHRFNPNSTDDKKWLFYECFNCKLQYTQRRLSVDKHALQKFMEDDREVVRLFASICLRYRMSATMAGKLRTPLIKGRMHTHYNLAGTVTGRLASKESNLGGGTNLQNLKPGIQRQMLVPDEGEEFIYADLWAAEAYLTALDAKQTNMVEMLQKGIKIHNWLLEETKKKFPKECANSDYTYKDAKQGVHAMNYNVKPELMARESGLPLPVCQWQYDDLYHKKFPGIKLRMLTMKNKIDTTGTCTSPLGRIRYFLAPRDGDFYNKVYAWPTQSAIGELTVSAVAKLYWYGRMHDVYPEKFPLSIIPALNTHDGTAARIPKGKRDQARERLRAAFAKVFDNEGVKVCIPVECGFAENFNTIKDTEILYYEP